MRSLALAVTVIAACYTPGIPSQVPCSPTGECPAGQMCVAGTCTLGGSGASTDSDGDGRVDSADNCPQVRNPEQGNEDSDALGDDCDPCPYVAETSVVDGDGDGIGDACDPYRPRRDTIWLFDGFPAGPPRWPGSDNWTAAGDGDHVRINAIGNPEGESRTLPLSLVGRMYTSFTAVVAFTIDTPIGFDGPALGFSVYDANRDESLDCNVYQNGSSATDHRLVLEDLAMQKEPAFAWRVGVAYTLTLTVDNGKYTCGVVGPDGEQSAEITSPVTPRDGGALDLFAYDTTAGVDWVYVVGQ